MAKPTPISDAEFIRLYPTTRNVDLVQLLGTTIDSLKDRAGRLGVRKSHEHMVELRRQEQLARPLVTRRHSATTLAKITAAATGRVFSVETVLKRAATFRKNPKWKGHGPEERLRRFKDPRYKAWREAVLDRDAYTCRDCGWAPERRKGKGLHAHHLKSFNDYPELRYEVSNGLTLCRSCHAARHGWLAQPPVTPPLASQVGAEGLRLLLDALGFP